MTTAPHQAEEENDVSTHGEDTANTTDTEAPDTAESESKSDSKDQAAEPKVRTAAEIVAAAKEKAAKEEAAADPKAATKPVVAKPAPAKPVVDDAGKSRSKVALSAVGSGVARVRNYAATIVWLVAVLCAAVLALGALFTVLDQANESNDIVSWVLDRGHDLVGPFEDVFKLETAKNTLLVNWGIAALAYLIVGKLLERIIRP